MRHSIRARQAIIILAALLLASALGQTYQLGRDFNGYHEYASAHSTVLARNLVELGPLAAKFGPVCNLNPLNNKLYYYLYHPCLDMYFFAVPFIVFGASALTARLTAMFYFAAGGVLFYLLIASLWTHQLALWSVFFYLFMPISQYYSKMAGAGALILPLMFLFLLLYHRWRQSQRAGYYYALILTLVISCLTSWYAYLLALFVVIHQGISAKKADLRLLAILLIAGALFFCHLSFNKLLTGSFLANQQVWPAQFQEQAPAAGYQLGMIEHLINDRLKFDLLLQSSYYTALFSHFLISLTLPIILAVGFVAINRRAFPRYLNYAGLLVLLPSLVYFGYGLLNPKTLMDHIGLVIFLTPAAAAMTACLVVGLKKLWQTAFVLVFLLFSLSNIIQLYQLNNTPLAEIAVGQSLALQTEKADGIAVSLPFFSPLVEFYAHRPILYAVDSWEKLDYIIKHKKINYFATNWPDFQRRLEGRFPAIGLDYNFQLFKLK